MASMRALALWLFVVLLSVAGSQIAAIECNSGMYGLPTDESCKVCGSGRYSGKGQSECTKCPLGKYLFDNGTGAMAHDSIEDCLDCEVGKYAGLHGESRTG